MKKIWIILILFFLIGCNAKAEPNIETTNLKNALKDLQNQKEISVYETIELRWQTNLYMKNTMTKFNLSTNQNLEMEQIKELKKNGVAQPILKEENYVYRCEGTYQKILKDKSRLALEESITWKDLLGVESILAALDQGDKKDHIYQIPANAFYLKLKEYAEDNMPMEALDNKKVFVFVVLEDKKIKSLAVDFTSLFVGTEKFHYSVSFKYTSDRILKPLWITNADDYKEPIVVRAYPHLEQDPEEVLVKHIDIGKYDTRGLELSSFAADQDKGESTYIKIGTIDILVDAAQNNNPNNASVRAIKEVIEQTSEDKELDYVVVTHPHADHYGGMSQIFSSYTPKMVIESSGQYSGTGWRNYQSARERAVSQGASFCTALDMINNKTEKCQRTLYLAPSITLTMLDTGTLSSTSPNPSSIVFVLNIFGTTYLLQGDAEKDQEARYARQAGKIHIMKMPHHGTKNAMSDYFLQQCNPENIIIQNGNNLGNQYGHPTSATINRIYKHNSKTNIYAVTGGGFGDYCDYSVGGEKTCSKLPAGEDFKATFDPNRFKERNGTITSTITKTGYQITSDLSTIIEISQTQFWITNSNRRFSHQ